MWLWGNITVFFIFQVVASVFFKWGSLGPEKYWWGFVLGNLFGMTSIMMLINVYKLLSPGATLAICTGGAFILNQIGLQLIYRQPISLSGWGGITLIFAGILIFALSAPTNSSPVSVKVETSQGISSQVKSGGYHGTLVGSKGEFQYGGKRTQTEDLLQD